MSELLAKLASHAKWPDGTVGGGIAKITAEDVAGACKGMTRHIYLYAMVKFTMDANCLPDLYRENRIAVTHRARIKGWKIGQNGGVDCLYKLADMALEGAIWPKMCRYCCGAAVQMNQKSCPRCKGTGKAPEISARRKGKIVGVSHGTWLEFYESKYQEVMLELIQFDGIIDGHIRRRLYAKND